jgi:hypothetical protein
MFSLTVATLLSFSLFGWNVFILIGEDLRDSVDDVTSHIE